MRWLGTIVWGPDVAYYLLASESNGNNEAIKIVFPTGTYTPGVRDHILRFLRRMSRFLFPFRISIKRR